MKRALRFCLAVTAGVGCAEIARYVALGTWTSHAQASTAFACAMVLLYELHTNGERKR